MTSIPRRRHVSTLIIVCALLVTAGLSQSRAQFNPPRVTHKIHTRNTGSESEHALKESRIYIDAGREVGIKQGDRLNVYRETRSPGRRKPIRLLIGTTLITESQDGLSVGEFEVASATTIGTS